MPGSEPEDVGSIPTSGTLECRVQSTTYGAFYSAFRTLNSASQWPGRQPADHSHSECEMLWVQLPPGPLESVSSSKLRAIGNLKLGTLNSERKKMVHSSIGTGLSHRKKGFDSPVDHCDTWEAQPVERLPEEQEACRFDSDPRYLLQAAWRRLTLIRSADPVRFRGLQLPVPWSSGNDPRPTTGQRWFESIRDYCNRFAFRVSGSRTRKT